jgi:hypothetical protein
MTFGRRGRPVIWWLLVGTALCGVLATAWWLFRGRAKLGADGWFLEPWPQSWPLGAWGLPVAWLVLFGGLAALSAYDRFFRAKTRREQSASTVMAVGALMLLSLGWNWTLLGPSGTLFGARSGTFNLVAALWSDLATEYFGVAHQIDNPRQFAREYAEKWQQPASALQAHVATHPPGAVLFYYGVRRLVESNLSIGSTFSRLAEHASGQSAVEIAVQANELRATAARVAKAPAPAPLPLPAVGTAMGVVLVIALLLALAVPAVYLTAFNLTQSTSDGALDAVATAEVRGLMAAALWVLAPTVGLFSYTLDAVLAALAACVFAGAAKYFQSGRKRWMVAGGAVLALASFVSFGALTIGAIVALWALVWRGMQGQWRQVGRDALCFGGGFGAMLLGLWLLFPFALSQVFQQAMAAHHMATLSVRTSRSWAWLNFVSFLLFAGWPLVAANVAGAWQLRRNVQADAALMIAAGGALLLITLAGSVRGETERLWLPFLAPFCVFAASLFNVAPCAAKLKPKRPTWPVIAAVSLLVLQALQTLLMAGTLAPLVTPV